ncbi:MAG: sterol desaturase family protein [Pseudomonadota bacterium]
MLDILLYTSIFLGTVGAMELVAWVTHKYVMHGLLWNLHKSHHAPYEGGFEKNDWFGIFFSAVSISLMILGLHLWFPLFFVGLGLVGYGAIYLFMHDILVHHRFGFRVVPRGGYLQRMYQAHRLHHAVAEKDGAVSFGFLIAPSIAVLKEQLRMNRARGADVDEQTIETSHDWRAG